MQRSCETVSCPAVLVVLVGHRGGHPKPNIDEELPAGKEVEIVSGQMGRSLILARSLALRRLPGRSPRRHADPLPGALT